MKRASRSNRKYIILLFAGILLGYTVYRSLSGWLTGPDRDYQVEPAVEETSLDSMTDPKSLIKKAISDNPVFLFSKSYCPYCKYATVDQLLCTCGIIGVITARAM